MLLLVALPAFAGSCDAQLAKVGSLTPDTVTAAYTDLVACDRAVAETNFNAYLEKATDADTLVALALVAVEKETWKPLWTALGKITSYEAREEVAKNVGAACTTQPKVVSFLEGAYFSLRDIEFQQWAPAFSSCTDPGMWTWMDKTVASPPNKVFDEKYDALLSVYARVRHGDALPSLTTAAQKASSSGPFDIILQRMGDAIAPGIGETTDPALQQKLAEALVTVAKGVDVDKARSVANQLANSGADAQAAQLLPTIYPGRQQGGYYTYGGASVEAGDCGGKKQAVIHYAAILEPGKRFTILGDIEAPLRASKARLKGCTMEGDWPVVHTPEPLAAGAKVDDWVKDLEKEWTDKGYDVKTQKEKDVKLP